MRWLSTTDSVISANYKIFKSDPLYKLQSDADLLHIAIK